MTSAPGDGDRPVEPSPPVVVTVDAFSVVVFASVAIVASAIWATATIAPDMVTRVAVGLLVGVALSPVAATVKRRWAASSGTAAAVVGGGLVLFFAAVVLLVAPPAVEQARQFSRELPATVRELYSWPLVGHRLERADAAGQVEDLIDELPARLDDETLAQLGERLLGGVVSTVVVLITAIGVLIDGERMVQRARSVVPAGHHDRVDAVGRIVYQSFGSYFAGSVLVAVLNGVVILTLGLLLGVPLAPIAALWAMLTNLIPQIGGFLGGSFLVLLALTESPVAALIAGLVFLGYQQLENNIISPAIVGKAVNLTPPTTMLAALVGGAAAGVPGALVATPLIGAAKALYLEQRGRRRPQSDVTITEEVTSRFQRLRARFHR